MATGTIKKQQVTIYTDRQSKSVYDIPYSALRQRRLYGCALVGAWQDLYLLFYIGDNGIKIKKIDGFGTGSCSVTYDDYTDIVTLTFSGKIWEGISVLPL